MDQATHNRIVSFFWGIADDVLRDLFKRGKYPDVILPMCVRRHMDAVLEPTKQAVLDTRKMLDDAGITEQRAALSDTSGQAGYNTSRFTLRDLKLIRKAVSWRVESAPPVIAKVHKPGKLKADAMAGRYDAVIGGKRCPVEYEPDADLRDTEQVPLLEEGGIAPFIAREVLPYTSGAWVNQGATRIGYE